VFGKIEDIMQIKTNHNLQTKQASVNARAQKMVEVRFECRNGMYCVFVQNILLPARQANAMRT
jgi:hypothetical protein